MNIEQLEKLANDGYDMNILYLLTLKPEELKGFANTKIKAWVSSCVRKQLLTEEYALTLTGKELLEIYTNKQVEEAPKKEQIMQKFEEWWDIYPSSDNFIHKGRTFQGIQSKRLAKTKGADNCWGNWRKIINEGKFTMDDVIRATKYHIDTAKDLSVKKGENQLTFIPNSERYLRIQSFAPYVEISRNHVKKEDKKGDTFI